MTAHDNLASLPLARRIYCWAWAFYVQFILKD